ncbi:hypothetical protein FB45DRAFT_1030472 [Roridomyces roridus]|uniref:F-box domain-containing protein n=1 Tax=Roridomyces roridus TaxID=1738132 RepID=A0AAD7BNQ4_9AGAR|nr:hypothetical protein FB45DRAFT_1030472 [Roridomyces roridus]
MTSGSSHRSLRARLADIDAETIILHARLAALAAERKPIVEALRSATYPVIDLPAEITAEIFLQYFTRAQIGGTEPGVAVCRKWREIALALQPIWSKFYVVTRSTVPSSLGNLLEYWLQRAGTHPLDVSLFHADISVLTLLEPYMGQLETFECFARTELGLPNELLQGKIPNLRSLTITCGDEVTVPITAFVGCLQLRELCLASFPPAGMDISWGHLTRLELIDMSLDESLTILRDTPALQTLTANIYEHMDDPIPATTSIRLTQLHTLKFDKYHRSLQLLEHLTLPSLADIEFPLADVNTHFGMLNLTSDVPRFAACLQRSACNLRSITLHAPGLSDAVQCLRAAGPTLAVINLRDVDWDSRSVDHFFRESLKDTEGFVPGLTSLSINPCLKAVEIPFGELASVIAARRGKLRAFELVLAGERSDGGRQPLVEIEDGLDALRALKKDGVKIDIRGLQSITDPVDPLAVYPPMLPRQDD